VQLYRRTFHNEAEIHITLSQRWSNFRNAELIKSHLYLSAAMQTGTTDSTYSPVHESLYEGFPGKHPLVTQQLVCFYPPAAAATATNSREKFSVSTSRSGHRWLNTPTRVAPPANVINNPEARMSRCRFICARQETQQRPCLGRKCQNTDVARCLISSPMNGNQQQRSPRAASTNRTLTSAVEYSR